MITLIDLLQEIKGAVDTSAVVKKSTITTYEDLLIRVSEDKNEYIHVFIVYDLNQIVVNEYSTTVPLTLVLCDKLRTNKENEIYIHNNTVSLAVDLIKIIRNRITQLGYEGVNSVNINVWTEEEADSLLAGTKLDLTLTVDIGGYCDYPEL